MSSRRQNANFEKFKFKLLKKSNKYSALCSTCGVELKNTAASRLQSHRNICQATNDNDQSFAESVSNTDSDTVSENWIEMQVSPNDGCLKPVQNLTSTCVNTTSITSSGTLDSFLNSSDLSTTSESHISSNKSTLISTPTSRPTKKVKITNFVDKLSSKEEIDLNEALAEFFFGCNIPFNTVKSSHFKNFVKKLHPAYAIKLPARKSLCSGLLDKTYDKCRARARDSLNKDSVLLIDGWKNSSSNCKTVVCMLHTANGHQAFLNAWDLTGDSETRERLSDIIYESIEIAKNMYETNVYAAVSDNASAMIKMGRLVSHVIWHSTCSSHTANLLAKDVLNKTCTEKVITVMKEFKPADLEKSVVEKGGQRIKLPCDTRWCSYRDSYLCLMKNLPYMKLTAADASCKKIKQDVAKLIFDDNFIEEVSENIKLFNPICELINKCQRFDCIADAANLWLNLKLPEKFQNNFNTCVKARRDMALNIYALTAYYLHPYYDNSKLEKSARDKINLFLFKNLDGEGIEERDSFRNNSGLFKVLYMKEVEKPLVFWRMAEMNFPKLAMIALKLLQIPASSAQIERVFSNWAHIHSPLRNRLTFEKSKKLMHVYYSLSLLDDPTAVDNEDDIVEAN